MSDIDLVVFNLAGATVRGVDNDSAALGDTIAALGLPIPPAEIESLRDRPARDAIEHVLLHYSPEQAEAGIIDRLLADFNQRLKGMKRAPGVRPLEGAEEVFRWLRQRGMKVALVAELDRKTVTLATASLKWDARVVDAVVCREDVTAGPPAPYLIFRAMELTGVVKPGRVATVGNTVRDLEAGANAAVGMNVGVLSGGEEKEKLEAAPHTHLIESVRKFPSLLAAPEVVPPVDEPVAKPPIAKPPDSMGPGFTSGSGLQGG